MKIALAHCWTGNSGVAWYPWLRATLEEKGLAVAIPDLPSPETPRRAEWVDALAQAVGTPDASTVLVGHSLGCAAVLHYLAGLPEGTRVGAVILVAGLSHDLGVPELADFYAAPFDFAAIARRSAHFYSIVSDNDRYAGAHYLEHADVFRTRLGAQVTVLPGMGHFSPGEGCTAVPEVAVRVLAHAAGLPRAA